MLRHSATLLLWSVLAAFLLVRPLDDVDLFAHVRLGELVLNNFSLVSTESFTLTHYGESYVQLGWLGDSVLALLKKLGGYQLVQLVHIVFFALGIVVAASISSSKTGLSTIIASVLCFLTVASNSSARGQTFAVLLFPILIALAIRRRWELFLLGAILWQNLHPSLPIFVFYFLAFALGNMLQNQLLKPTKAELLPVALSVAATVLTPIGFKTFEASRKNAEIANFIGVSEWLPPWHSSVAEAMGMFWIALFLSLLLLLRRPKILISGYGFGALALTVVSLISARFTLFWALAMAPIWCELFAGYRLSLNIAPQLRLAFASLLMVGITAITLGQRANFVGNFPMQDIANLEKIEGVSNVYCYREWGSILVGQTKFRVSIHGLLHTFSKEDFIEYNRTALGEVEVADVERKFSPDAFFLHPSFHEKLIGKLERDDRWRKIDNTTRAVIFVRSEKLDQSV